MPRLVRTFAAAAIALAGCGRLGFALHGDGGGGSGGTGGGTDGGDGGSLDPDAMVTGPLGPRYAELLDGNAVSPLISGTLGRAAVAEQFVTATTIAGVALTGQAQYESWGLVWLDGSGAPGATSVLDSTSVCDLRALAPSGSGVIAAGIADSGATTPALGACAIQTSRQDGVAISVDAAGGQQLSAHLVSSSMNDQGWYAATFDDGSIAAAGVYGASGKLGSQVLPSTTSDENAWFARVDPSTGEPSWVAAISSTGSTYAGGIDPDGDDLCMIGAFSGSVSVLGTPMTSAGGDDEWVARVDATGAPRFVRQVGTTGEEATTGGIAIAATADGGCTVAMTAAGDLALDAISLPAAAGPAVLLHFDAGGTLAAGQRIAAVPHLARVPGGTYAALACAQPCELGGATYTPAGDDVAVFSVDDALAATEIAAVTGGATALTAFAAVPPDALAIGFTFGGQTTFGSMVLAAPPAAANGIAVLGVPP